MELPILKSDATINREILFPTNSSQEPLESTQNLVIGFSFLGILCSASLLSFIYHNLIFFCFYKKIIIFICYLLASTYIILGGMFLSVFLFLLIIMMLRKFGILQVMNEKRGQTNQRRFVFKER